MKLFYTVNNISIKDGHQTAAMLHEKQTVNKTHTKHGRQIATILHETDYQQDPHKAWSPDSNNIT